MVLLCSAHHRLVHEGGFELAGTGPAMELRDPRGRVVAQLPEPTPVESWSALLDLNADVGVRVDEWTNFPRWDGGAVDYGSAVATLLD